MRDETLADELIERLNRLLENDLVRRDVQALIEQRIPCSDDTAATEEIQVSVRNDGVPLLGFLGLLNGITGTVVPLGDKIGWGYIAAVYDEEGKLTKFTRADHPSIRPVGPGSSSPLI